jgi:SAM-dependent methyltransferase
MTSAERWLAAVWPLVREHLPPPPSRVIDIGCGPHGGFVPFLRDSGYDAVGVDSEAPATGPYHRVRFEELELQEPFDAAIASTSLHHVTDLELVIDRIADALSEGGALIVVEWAWEAFDDETARWCFERLGDDEAGWLQRHHDEWTASAQEWQPYLRDWATGEGLHRADDIVRLLDERFERRFMARGPCVFPDLADTSAADEQAAIDAGEIRATRIDWVGVPR